MTDEQKNDLYLLIVIVVGICALIIINLKAPLYDPARHTCIDSVKACKGMSGEELKQFYAGEIEQECYDKCIDWRPKTYCDQHPEDSERCVCEFQKFRPCVCRDYPDNRTYVGSEEKELCKDVDCSMNFECRKKTIDDLNCTELQDYFENGRRCEGVPPWRVCKYPPTDDKIDILYQIVVKC